MHRVFARKYRPKKFSEMVGQDVLVRIISNAVSFDKFPQAVLLSGSYGVGKTTAARIIAKMLNCLTSDVEPCLQCKSCLGVDTNTHPDVLEFDAASNTGVNDIRVMLESSQYTPMISRYRIYIIDEVHMLSVNAFNSLLKTLEEPLDHLKFILATTEVHKLPQTVISRCYCFTLHRIEIHTMKKYLADVIKKESILCEEEALLYIAQAAQGSVRDALSILEQGYICANDQGITKELIFTLTGKLSVLQISALVKGLLRRDTMCCIKEIEHLHSSGITSVRILETLLETIHILTRNKLYNRDVEDFSLREIVSTVSVEMLIRLWQAGLHGLAEVKNSFDSDITLQMLLIRMCYLSCLPPMTDLIRKSMCRDSTEHLTYKSKQDYNKGLTIADKILKAFEGAKLV